MNYNEDIKNYLLNTDSRKIKEQSLEEYLDDLKKNDIFEILSLYINGSKDVIGMYVLKEKSKRELIKFIKENLKDILSVHLKYMKLNVVDFLNDIVSRLADKNYDISDKDIPLNFVVYFKKFHLATFECSDDKIMCFMPKEFVKVFGDILKDKDLYNYIKNNNELFNYIMGVTYTYGIIDFDSLYSLVNKDLYKADKDILMNTFSSFEIADDFLQIYEYNDKVLICNNEFQTEDMAIDFYNIQSGDYKKYSKDDFKLISDNKYVEGFDSYHEFIDFLNDIFVLSDEDKKYITDFLIMNYLHSSQISKEDADMGFKGNAGGMFDLSDSEIEDMRRIAEKIYDEYPKWIKRGEV